MKTCNQCLTEKPLGDFYRHPETSDGRLGRCKSCHIGSVTRARVENREHYLRYDKDRASLPKRRVLARECARKRDFGGNWSLVMGRDSESCQSCGMTNAEHREKWNRNITVDHRDGNRQNNSMENLTTLCLTCHGQKDGKRRSN